MIVRRLLSSAYSASLSVWLILSIALGGQAAAQTPPGAESGQPDPAYLFITGWHKDASSQKAYIAKARPLIRKFGLVGAKLGAPGESLTVLEGDWIPRPFTLMQFPSEKALKQFWYSSEYQNEARPIRRGKSVVDVIKLRSVPGTPIGVNGESALLVFFADVVTPEKFTRDYAPRVPAVAARYGGDFLVRSAQWDMELLEGDFPSTSVMILEFPSGDALRAFWNDDEYRALSEIRKSTGKWSVVEIIP